MDLGAGAGPLVADAGRAGQDPLEQAAAVLGAQPEAELRDTRLRVGGRQVREIGDDDRHLARDAHGGQRRAAALGGCLEVDHVGARLQRHLRGERARDDVGGLAEHLDGRIGRADRAAHGQAVPRVVD